MGRRRLLRQPARRWLPGPGVGDHLGDPGRVPHDRCRRRRGRADRHRLHGGERRLVTGRPLRRRRRHQPADPVRRWHGWRPGLQRMLGYGGAGGAATAVEVGSSLECTDQRRHHCGRRRRRRRRIGAVHVGAAVRSVWPPTSPSPHPRRSPTASRPAVRRTVPPTTPSRARRHSPAEPTQGQAGIAVFTMCGGRHDGNEADQYFNTGAPDGEAGCDGGGGAGGGGGAAGRFGRQRRVRFGLIGRVVRARGKPGRELHRWNSRPECHSTPTTPTRTPARPAGRHVRRSRVREFDGSVMITYSTGVPAVADRSGRHARRRQPRPPVDGTQLAGRRRRSATTSSSTRATAGPTWVTDDTGSTATSATVSGLTNGTGYIFEVRGGELRRRRAVLHADGNADPDGTPRGADHHLDHRRRTAPSR